MKGLKNMSTWMLAILMLAPVVTAQAEEVSLQEALEKARIFVTQQEGLNSSSARWSADYLDPHVYAVKGRKGED